MIDDSAGPTSCVDHGWVSHPPKRSPLLVFMSYDPHNSLGSKGQPLLKIAQIPETSPQSNMAWASKIPAFVDCGGLLRFPIMIMSLGSIHIPSCLRRGTPKGDLWGNSKS